MSYIKFLSNDFLASYFQTQVGFGG